MNDEFLPTKSADEEDDDEASQEENEMQERENEEEDQDVAITAPTPTSDALNHGLQLVPAIVPIQPYYPPYPYHQYPSTDTSAVYIDQSLNLDPPADRRNRGGVTEPFPEKLHR